MNVIFHTLIALGTLYEFSIVAGSIGDSKISHESLLEDMDNILNDTFPESRCCQIYISPNPTLDEYKLFRKLLSEYGESYLISRQAYDCTDYIIIVSDDRGLGDILESIPVNIPSIRVLILMDSKLEIESYVFNGSIYGNSKVRIKNSRGVYILPENYVQPRVFRKVSKLKSSVIRESIVDLMGRNLQVATYYNPPFSFLRTSDAKMIDSIPVEIFVADNEEEWDGIELNLFLIIAKALNSTYTIRKPTGGYNHGRKINSTFWKGGMIAQIVNKEVDIAFGDIWLSHDAYSFVNLSEPWSQVSISFLVPRPKALSSLWGLVRPLSPFVWLLLAIVVGIESMCIRSKAKLDPLVPERYQSLRHDLVDLLARILGNTSVSAPPPQLRPHLVLWQLAGVIIVTFYCSSLAATLTNPDFEDRIDTIEQFIESNLTWGRENVHPQFDLYFNMKNPLSKLMPSRFILEKSSDDRMQRILTGSYAVVGRVVQNVYFPEGTLNNHTLQMLRVMRESVGKFYASFAVQPWLLGPVNSVMTRLKESGIVQYHLESVLHRKTGSYLREVFIEYDTIDPDQVMRLTINSLSPAFTVLILGILLASGVFYLELQSSQRNQTSPLYSRVADNKLAFIRIQYIE